MRIRGGIGPLATAGGEAGLAARAERMRMSLTEFVVAYNASVTPGETAKRPANGAAVNDGELSRLGITRTADGKLAFDEDAFARNIATGAMRPGDLVTTMQAVKSLAAASGDTRAAATGIGGRFSGAA